jgi:hypothetical protein
MRAVALAIAVVGAFASIAYYGTEQKRVEAAVVAACLQNGGNFYLAWSWKPVCERKEILRHVPD